MKKSKKEVGITLIALTITVIILLILAGVTIATISGDNGILQTRIKYSIIAKVSSNNQFSNL